MSSASHAEGMLNHLHGLFLNKRQRQASRRRVIRMDSGRSSPSSAFHECDRVWFMHHVERLEARVMLSGLPFMQSSSSDMKVVMEAEHAHRIIARNGQTWNQDSSIAGFVGTGALKAGPDLGSNINTDYINQSPQADYDIYFHTPGTYYVYLRGYATSGLDDSAHVGLNGQAVANADRMATPVLNAWHFFNDTMDGVVASIDVPTAGVHTLNLYMREDGFVVDRIWLSLLSSLNEPELRGPAESPRYDVNAIGPQVTVDFKGDTDTTPSINGSINDPNASISVVVNGQTYAATNFGSGRWAFWVTEHLRAGLYDVQVTATDANGNIGRDTTVNELTIITAPSAPDLMPESDTGVSPTDNITNLNNSNPTNALKFAVYNTIPGAIVELVRNGQVIGKGVGQIGTVVITTNGVNTLSNGIHDIRARQNYSGFPTYESSALNIQVDTQPPSVWVNATTVSTQTFNLTGTHSGAQRVEIEVAGQIGQATITGSTWTISSTQFNGFPVGTYNVIARAWDAAGKLGVDSTTNELLVNLSAPTTPDLLPDYDTGSSNTDNITRLNNSSPDKVLQFSVSNTTPGALVELRRSWQVIGSAVATGTTTIVTTNGSTTLSDGTSSISALQSYQSTAWTSPSVNVNVATNSPWVNFTGLTTGDTSPPLSGSHDGYATSITIQVDGETYQATVLITNWTLADNIIGPLTPGSYDVLITSTDVAGNSATVSYPDRLTINPLIPFTPDLLPDYDTGSSNTDNITRLNNSAPDKVLQFSVGNTTPGALVELWITNGFIGSAVATDTTTIITTNGTRAFYPSTLITAWQTFNNQTYLSKTLSLTIDTDEPTASVNHLMTADTTPPLSGTYSEPLSHLPITINLQVAGQTYQATILAFSNWTLEDNVIGPLPLGTYDVIAIATDLAGNQSTSTATNALSILRPAPGPIDLLAVSDTGSSNADNITRLNNSAPDKVLQFNVSNTTPGALVELLLGTTVIGSATADGTTTLVTTDGSTILAEGSNSITARQTLSGISSMPSSVLRITIDTLAPTASVSTSAGDTTPPISGTHTGASTLTIQVAGQTYLPSSLSSSSWYIADNIVGPLEYGNYDITYNATDLAGNQATTTQTNALRIIPPTPSTPDLLPVSDTGSSSTDNITRFNNSAPDKLLQFSVANTMVGALVEVLAGTTVIGSAVTTGGTTIITTDGLTSLPVGSYSIIARQSINNSASLSSSSLIIAIDTVAPTLTINPLSTFDATPPLSGTRDGAASITIAVAGQTFAPTSITSTIWSLENNILSALPVGTYDVIVTATDAAGNQGTDTTVDELQILPPPALTVTSQSVQNQGYINYNTTTFIIGFSNNLLASTIGRQDMTLGGVAATASSLSGGRITFSLPTLADGPAELLIPAGAFTDIYDQPNAEIRLNLTIDRTAPRVINTTLQQNDVLEPGDLTVIVTFSEAINSSVLVYQSMSMRNRLPWPGTSINAYGNPISFAFNPVGDQVTMKFINVYENSWELSLYSTGFNRDYQDLAGNFLDGEVTTWPIGPNVSGNGIPGGNFITEFYVDRSQALVLDDFQRIGPTGSLIGYGNQTNPRIALDLASDQDEIQVNVPANQPFTLVIKPPTYLPTPLPYFTLTGLGESRSSIGAILSWYFPHGAGVDHPVFTLTSNQATAYQVEVFLNADYETANFQQTPMSIDHTRMDIGGGSRWAVIGNHRNTTTTPTVDTFSLDLSNHVGQSLQILLSELSPVWSPVWSQRFLTLYLHRPDGSVWSTSSVPIIKSSSTPVNYDAGFVVGPITQPGIYTIKVTGRDGDYALVATTSLPIETEANNRPIDPSFSTFPTLTGNHKVIGYAKADAPGSKLFGLQTTYAGAYGSEGSHIVELDPETGAPLRVLVPTSTDGFQHYGIATDNDGVYSLTIDRTRYNSPSYLNRYDLVSGELLSSVQLSPPPKYILQRVYGFGR